MAMYLAHHRKMMVHCECGASLGEFFRDHLECGLRNESCQKHTEPELSLNKAREIALETADAYGQTDKDNEPILRQLLHIFGRGKTLFQQ